MWGDQHTSQHTSSDIYRRVADEDNRIKGLKYKPRLESEKGMQLDEEIGPPVHRYQGYRDALLAACGCKGQTLPSALVIGQKLGSFLGRPTGEYKLMAETDRNHTKHWYWSKTVQPEVRGCCGCSAGVDLEVTPAEEVSKNTHQVRAAGVAGVQNEISNRRKRILMTLIGGVYFLRGKEVLLQHPQHPQGRPVHIIQGQPARVLTGATPADLRRTRTPSPRWGTSGFIETSAE